MVGTILHFAGPNRGKRFSRTVALFVSALCLTGQLLAVAHEATERHVLCAEHGELTHVRSAPVSSTDPDRNDVVNAWPEVAPGHDHCGFVARVSRRQAGRSILVVNSAPEPRPRPQPAPAPIVRPQTELILLSAPKIAPPC
jgi:hypothetical protein